MSPKKSKQENGAKVWVLASIMVSLGIGCLGIIFFSWQAPSWAEFLSIIGVAFLIAVAAFFSGGLLGFVFGIPKKQDPAPAPAAPAPPTPSAAGTPAAAAGSPTPAAGSAAAAQPSGGGYQGNTNLEQISDWLSKILVGAGLTQLTAIPPVLKKYAIWFAPGLGDFGFKSQVFAMGLLVFFTVCGFLVGYLWTRLYLVKAMSEADIAGLRAQVTQVGAQVTQVGSKLKNLEEQAKIDAMALSLVERQLNPITGTPMPSQKDITAAIKPASTPARSRIFFKAQKLREENWRLDKARMAMTIPIFLALIEADEENIYHANHAELGFALKDQDNPQWREAEEKLTKAIDIRNYLGGKGYLIYEFNRALCRIYQDAGFKLGPSDDQTKQAILADLKPAAQDASLRALIEKEPDIKTWLGNNNLDLSAICPASIP